MAATAFSQYMELQLQNFTSAAAQQMLVAKAKEVKAEVLSQYLVRPDVHIETDGHPATREEEAKPYGVIVYRFTSMGEIAAFALEQAKMFSPVESGKYRDSWFALVDGEVATEGSFAGAKEVIITNDRPYARKINVGAHGFEAYAGIVEKVRQAVIRQYGGNTGLVDAGIAFLNLRTGHGYYEVPWILRAGLRKITTARRVGKKIIPGHRYGGIRNDAGAGMEITYPSLVITSRYPGR